MTVSTIRSVDTNAGAAQHFQTWLIRTMAERSITRKQLQERTGVIRGTVDGWLRGSIPRQETLNAIAQALGVDVIEAHIAAGYMHPDERERTGPTPVGDVPPLTDAEILALRDFLATYSEDRLLMFRQLGAMLGDITPIQWQRLRRLADNPPR